MAVTHLGGRGRRLSEATRCELRGRDIAVLQSSASALGQDFLCRADYDDWRKHQRRQNGNAAAYLPSLGTLVNHFGSFTAALRAAGLKTQRQHRTRNRLDYARPQPALGPDETLVIEYTLSLVLGKTFGGERYAAYKLCRVVAALAGVSGPGREGGWPSGKFVLKWLELTPADLDARWAVAETEDRLLPRELLAAFVPTSLWPALFGLIKAGPFDTWERIRVLLKAWALGREPGGEPRKQIGTRRSTLEHGGLSEAAIDSMLIAVFGVMRTLDELRVLEHNGRLQLPRDRSYFARWTRNEFPRWPRPEELAATPAGTNRDGPTLRLIRLRLQMFCDQIETLKQTTQGRGRLFRPLRDRAIVATFAVTGLRRGAFSRLNVGDIEEDFAFPDNERGPAIVPRPGKTLSRDLKRPKGIPPFLFDWIKEYAEYAGIWGGAETPLWLAHDPRSQRPIERMDANSIYELVRMRFAPQRTKPGEPPETRPLYLAFLEEHDGRVYGPHQLRHAAEQIGFVVGLDWLEENRATLLENGTGLPGSPQVFPDALLDHTMPSMGDRYKDVSSEQGRLKWARKCALGIGDYLIGSKGARRGPDLALLREKKMALEHAGARRTEVEAQLAAIEERIGNGGDALASKDILLAVFQTITLSRQLASVAQAVERAGTELAEARKAEVPLPDYLANAELEALRENPSAHVASPTEGDDETLPALREWASLQEFHWALGGQAAVSMETLRRWARGESTLLARTLGLGDSRNGSRPACVERLSERKQRILLDRLDWSRLPVQVQENLEAIRRAPEDLQAHETTS